MLIVHENQPTLKHVKGASWCKLRHAKIEGGKCTRKVICLSNNPIHHMHKLLPVLEMLQFEIGHTQSEMKLYSYGRLPPIFDNLMYVLYLPSYQYKL